MTTEAELRAERDAALAMVAVIRDRATTVMAERGDSAATVCEQRLLDALDTTSAAATEYERRVRADERRIHDENCIDIEGEGIAPDSVSEDCCYTSRCVREKLRRVRTEERVAANLRTLDFIDELATAFEKDGKVYSAASIRTELKKARAAIAALTPPATEKP